MTHLIYVIPNVKTPGKNDKKLSTHPQHPIKQTREAAAIQSALASEQEATCQPYPDYSQAN